MTTVLARTYFVQELNGRIADDEIVLVERENKMSKCKKEIIMFSGQKIV